MDDLRGPGEGGGEPAQDGGPAAHGGDAAQGAGDLDRTLDPHSWDELRALGGRMLDDLVEDLRSLRERPAWQPVPPAVRAALRGPVPQEPAGPDAAYEDYLRLVRPYPRGNNHPRFWGWVNGSGLPMGMLADLLAAGLNPSVGAAESAATLVEAQVLQWLKAMLDYPGDAGALLTSGCSMSNLIGLAVARTAHAPFDVRALGMAAAPEPMVLYASAEAHSSIVKAVELLGLGRASLRLLPVDADYRLDLGALEAAVLADLRAGLRPFCVVGSAGTVNTGAVDDLEGLAALCRRHRLWLHVDAAFGAMAWLCPELRPALLGLQHADSLAFDLHKWMYLPYDVGCVFVRDARAQHATFGHTTPYLDSERNGDGAVRFGDYGIELSRRFRALKVWLALKEHGVRGFAEQVRQNVAQARYLAARVEAADGLELAAPVALNVVCLRAAPAGLDAAALDDLNAEVLARVQASGAAMPSSTRLGGRFVLRVAVTNHRSRREDFDVLLAAVRAAVREALAARAADVAAG